MTIVVGIGASAGGVTAIAAVLASLPKDFPAAILVVQHQDPHGHSFLAPVLARECRLPVRKAVAGETITAGTVYVAPPGIHLAVRDGQVALSEAAPVHYSRPSVDVLFRSIADACGPRAVAVILTGAGQDGAAGLRAIKAAGGRTIVQDPVDAEYAGMPTAAHATGCADMTLPLHDIGPALMTLVCEATT